jgi:hypothetical protein
MRRIARSHLLVFRNLLHVSGLGGSFEELIQINHPLSSLISSYQLLQDRLRQSLLLLLLNSIKIARFNTSFLSDLNLTLLRLSLLVVDFPICQLFIIASSFPIHAS